MSRNYFDPNLGDEIILTCTLPMWARGENRQMIFATMLCALSQSTGATKETNTNKVRWFIVDDLAIHPKGQRVVCVFVRGDEPESELEGELNLEDLLKEDNDGSQKDPPPAP